MARIYKILGLAVVVAIGAMLALPFGRDAYYRHQVENRLDSVMDDSDRAAFRQWNGDAASFLKTLYDRCVRQQGASAPACDRYRMEFQ